MISHWIGELIRLVYRLVLLSVIVFSVACCVSQTASENSGQHPSKTYVYECESGDSIVVNIKDQSAWLFLPHNTVQLHPVAGEDETFSNGSITYWRQGEQATIETPDKKYQQCRNNRQLAIWENAKLRGVDFRATGNEPGWYLEISQMEKILLVTDYGQRRLEFTSIERSTDPVARTTIYHANNDKHKLVLALEGRKCTDSMSEQQFQTTVMFVLDEIEYRGCGAALH